MNEHIEVKDMPTMVLAGITGAGFQNVASNYERLVHWAGSNKLLDRDCKMVTIYHDSAKTTAHDKIKISATILLNKPVDVEGEVSLITINPGRCIVAAQEIKMSEFQFAWERLYRWMNETGHRPAAAKPFEIYHNNYQEHPEKKCIVDFCIPIT